MTNGRPESSGAREAAAPGAIPETVASRATEADPRDVVDPRDVAASQVTTSPAAAASPATPAAPAARAGTATTATTATPACPATPQATADPGDQADHLADRDRLLVERAREGDLDAFNELVLAYQDHLWALVVRLVPDPDQANDVVQEAFFSAYRNLGTYRGGSVRSWLSRMAINAAMDVQRARRRRPAGPYPELEDEDWQPPAPASSDPEATAIAAERSRILAEALREITADQRTAIVLYDVEGYDYAQIAELTGVSLGTVKSRIHRGRLALRRLLEARLDLFRR